MGRVVQAEMESVVLDAILPRLSSLVGRPQDEPHLTAPIVSDAAWDSFVAELDFFEGKREGGRVDVIPQPRL